MDKIFLSELTRSRALIFGMLLSILFKTKSGPVLGGHMFNIGIYWKK